MALFPTMAVSAAKVSPIHYCTYPSSTCGLDEQLRTCRRAQFSISQEHTPKMKDNNEVIAEFNDYVNMTASELEKWLKSDDSNSAGWPKDGDKNGESVGHDSGRQIVEILKSNPEKDADKYTDDQLQHMRKVAAYCKRHLAQEAAGNKEKDPEEVKETKSYISLKNWGHDFLKAQGKDSGPASGRAAKASPKKTQTDKDAKSKEVEIPSAILRRQAMARKRRTSQKKRVKRATLMSMLQEDRRSMKMRKCLKTTKIHTTRRSANSRKTPRQMTIRKRRRSKRTVKSTRAIMTLLMQMRNLKMRRALGISERRWTSRTIPRRKEIPARQGPPPSRVTKMRTRTTMKKVKMTMQAMGQKEKLTTVPERRRLSKDRKRGRL